MSEPFPPDRTVDHGSADDFDAGMAAAFGPDSGPPLPANNSVVRALGALLPEVPQVQLRQDEDDTGAPDVQPASEQMPAQHDPTSRLQLHGEIARGGMGAVLRGRDADLGREIAVKVLLEAHAGRTELVQRFVEEAQISGQLQHPGIVPVYEMGQFADKRPYFTMKLVKGQTLAKLLAGRAEPAQERSRFVGVFLQVCQAMAYAHAHGVIHRDLKPSNLIVGSYGEVQVLDWGLAKVVKPGGSDEASRKREQPEDVTAIHTHRSAKGSGTDTQTGSVLGTPAYMPPEQALGEIDRLDERADVFGLGAILCEILTGQPPYVGTDFHQVHRKAVRADLADALARLDGCGADAELVALCKRCLAAEPLDRPRDAGVVAEAVSSHLRGVAERLRRAELERAAAEAKAVEERKRRRVQLGLAAALVGLVVVGAGGGLVVQHQAARAQQERVQREVELRGAVTNAMTQVETLQQQSRWPEARVLLTQALARLEATGHDDLREPLQQKLADLDLIDRLDAIRLQRLTIVEGKFDNEPDLLKADRAYAALFKQARLADEKEPAATVAERLASSAIKPQLVAALEAWAATRKDRGQSVWMLEVARLLDPHPLRDRLRDPAIRADPEALAKVAAQAQAEHLSPLLAVGLGLRLRSEQALALLEVVQRRHPEDFWVNFTLGVLLSVRPRTEEGVGYLRVAVALRPSISVVRYNLGVSLNALGKVDEAIECFRKASELDPNFTMAHSNLGAALFVKGKVDEAIECYRKALDLDPNNAKAHNNLGAALSDKGKVDEAIKRFRKALEIDRNLAEAHGNLGIAMANKGEMDEAIERLRKAIELDPNNAATLCSLGNALRAKGRIDEAIESYRKALQLDPKHAMAHNNLGNALSAKGKVDEAIDCFRKAIEIDPNDAKRHSNLGNALKVKGKVDEAIESYRKALQLNPNDAGAHTNLGLTLYAKGKLDEAVACYRKAIEIDPQAATAHTNLGIALHNKGKVDEAIECFRKALQLEPKWALVHTNLGIALHNKGKVDEAIESYRKALQLNPDYANAHNNLGLALYDQGKADEAIESYRKALQLDPNNAPAHTSLGVALLNKGKVDEAIECFRKALQLDPTLVRAHGALGQSLLVQGRYAEALASTQRALDLLPQNGPLRQLITRQLESCRRLLDLESRLLTILRGQAQPADARERLTLADMCVSHKRLYAAAARFYAEAFAEQPALAADLRPQLRYNAACAAALAANGQGKDAARVTAPQKQALRRQALTWLRADLAAWTRVAANGPADLKRRLPQTLAHGQQDADLAGLRDAPALATLPVEERAACQRLWADVAAVLKQAGEKK